MNIYKEFVAEAAHWLPNVPKGHKCGRLHGHSFKIRIHVSGEIDDHTGWVRDFADIKKVFKPYYEMIDHNCLNHIEGLENPTSENLCRWIWVMLENQLADLYKVEVFETCTSGCSYKGPKHG